jgi:hypothetical protein
MGSKSLSYPRKEGPAYDLPTTNLPGKKLIPSKAQAKF